MTHGKIIPIKKETVTETTVATDDRHVQLAEKFLQDLPESRKQKNLTPVVVQFRPTRKSRVALIVAPEWSNFAPAYGIARMAALSRHSGFETRMWDLNINCMLEGPKEYWSSYLDWQWLDPYYSEHIHPKLEPILEKYIYDIVTWNPSIIGFSVWYTNDTCTIWLAKELRKRLPGVKIILGGPQCTQGKLSDPSVADHVVQGEGEPWFVRLLENIEANDPPFPHTLIQPKEERVDLDSMPPADYQDININNYSSNGISSEFSRGCIAKCQYCSETTFWKFRARQATSVLEEIEIAYKNQGVRNVWFIDSLLNGNLRELRLFAQGLKERDIIIRWTGYSRIDPKIDKEFWRELKTAGAWGFAFGVESGSQKVLDLMKKNCPVEAIEQNFRDLGDIDMCNNFATWFTGFPGEDLEDVAQTMALMWRLRNTGMGDQSSGTCGLNVDTPLHLERERFNIAPTDWCHGWHTLDMANTGFHRFVRFKLTNILLENFRAHNTVRKYNTRIHYPGLQKQYQLECNPTAWRDNIPHYEKDFDYKIIKTSINPVADSLVNEIWPLLRVLWLGMGAYKFYVEFDPDDDLQEFGYSRYPQGGDHKLWAKYNFIINESGHWQADFEIKLKADPWQNQEMDFDFTWSGQGNWLRPVDNNWLI